MRILVIALSVMAAGGCLPSEGPRPSDDALRARFTAERDAFEALRRAILVEPKLSVVRRDALVWSEPCPEWSGGCGRWIDGAPTASALARVGAMPESRARAYLDGLAHVGATALVRESPSRVAFWMHLGGIVPSGSTKSIVWSGTPEREPFVDDTERGPMRAHGLRAARLADGGWSIELEWN